jgi:DNA replication protein DnaC
MLKNILADLRMKGALAAYESLQKIEGKNEFAIALLQAEYDYKQQLLRERRLKKATFSIDKEWHEIDPSLNPKIDFKKVQLFGNGEFVKNKENLCLVGKQGTGKSHCLIALGRELCLNGYSVKFYTACGLVNALEEAKVQNKLIKFMKTVVEPSLLCIDELGFIPFTENGSRLLFDVFTSRYEKGSIAVSTNLTFDKWAQVFGSVELTAALIDRFTHKSHTVVYDGESVRLRQATQNRKRENVGRSKNG